MIICHFSEYIKQCTEPPPPLQILSTQIRNFTTPLLYHAYAHLVRSMH